VAARFLREGRMQTALMIAGIALFVASTARMAFLISRNTRSSIRWDASRAPVRWA
jgi:hypothetical protein